MEIKKIGVVGCGFMGSGITQVCAQSGYQVVVSEINDELLNKGLTTIDYYLTRSVLKGKISEQDKDSALARIKGTTNSKDFSDCDLVIEVVPENIDLKKEVFARIDKICPEHTILASNTSCISIFELAKATNRPEKVLGMHFLSPVPPSKLLEIVRS
ncbi:MAG: 3-hydroxybutyryl-CoA dehydrogenase, partial [Dehalococcoidales bacterium]|nr:3-hydroxybutyryl-CoA dehydrogenase [Dehalococcoidales bacterium]